MLVGDTHKKYPAINKKIVAKFLCAQSSYKSLWEKSIFQNNLKNHYYSVVFDCAWMMCFLNVESFSKWDNSKYEFILTEFLFPIDHDLNCLLHFHHEVFQLWNEMKRQNIDIQSISFSTHRTFGLKLNFENE